MIWGPQANSVLLFFTLSLTGNIDIGDGKRKYTKRLIPDSENTVKVKVLHSIFYLKVKSEREITMHLNVLYLFNVELLIRI